VLEWARAHGCPWDITTTERAARFGHFDVVLYALHADCGVNFNVVVEAAGALNAGGLRILTYLAEYGYFDDQIARCASEPLLAEMLATASVHAARAGNIDIIQFLHYRGFPWEERTCALAAYFGHFDILKWARDHGSGVHAVKTRARKQLVAGVYTC
jgi:hypothetical protein